MSLETMVYDLMEEVSEARDNVPTMVKTMAGDSIDNVFDSIEKLLTVMQLMAAKVDDYEQA